MFEFLFGWRKASKCKSLIKKLQCRVNLVKNKRCWIVRQLRQDVAELLKNGHTQTAFERVEQLLKDQRMVEVYDLVGSFCEFTIMNLGYIRKHKDCPNDIHEAVSTLIFTSARLGDLPELLSVRKLFAERYGLSFVTASLELHPGNLVNNQIKENLAYTKKVADDDVKYKLLDDIASSCVEPGPLLLEYKTSESLENRETESKKTQTGINNERICNVATESEGKIVHIDLQPEMLREEQNSFPKAIQLSVLGEDKMPGKPSEGNYENESLSSSSSSSSETSSRLPNEMIYLDDIEEFVSPATKNGQVQDQRLFMFKPFEIASKESAEYINDAISFKGQKLLQYEKNSGSRSSRKVEKPSRKRTRRRSFVSQENRNVMDAECELYYGFSQDTLTAQRHETHYHQRKDRYQILTDSFDLEGGNSERSCYVTVKSSINVMRCGYNSMGFVWRCNCNANISKKCGIEHPHNFHFRDRNESLEHLSSTPETKDHSVQSIKGSKIEDEPDFCKDYIRCKALGEARNEAQLSCLRAMTMPNARPVEIVTDNMFRSNSFPLETPLSCRHIHPKLPDYDELAAKFMALKRENLQNKNTIDKQASNINTDQD